MQPFPKMFKIESELDIEIDSQYAYVKLLTGQKVRLSREIVRQMYTGIVRRSGKVDEPEVMPAGEYQVINIEVIPPKRWPLPKDFPKIRWENNWPKGTANAPTWTTADGRTMLVTEMEDSHIQNSIIYFGKRLKELNEEKVSIIYMEGQEAFRTRRNKIYSRINMVKAEQKRRKAK